VTLVRYLHLLAMAFFVGGQLFLVAAVVPALRADDDRGRLRAIARRFGWGTLAAIAVLIGTGIPLASHFHLWESGTLHVKLASVAVVAGRLAHASPAGARPHLRARSSSDRWPSCGSASRSRTNRCRGRCSGQRSVLAPWGCGESRMAGVRKRHSLVYDRPRPTTKRTTG
jgi:hypothetical protein